MTRTILNACALILLFSFDAANAKTLTVAVIDTGVDKSIPKLCKYGHKSFIKQKVSSVEPKDDHGHGTHIASTIINEAGAGDYCVVSIKFFDQNADGSVNLANLIRSIRYAIDIKVDIINISGGGPEFNINEYKLILEALDNGITIVAAAGNDRLDLDKSCNYFPGCYDRRVIMVGNLEKTPHVDFLNYDLRHSYFSYALLTIPKTRRSSTSNFGKRITRWEIGTNVLSAVPGGKLSTMTGTSQAAAVATGKIIKEKLSNLK